MVIASKKQNQTNNLSMQAKFINPVLTSMVNVLSTMAKLHPTPGKPTIKKDNQALGAVTGIIAMEGEQAKGSLAVCFPKAVILDINKRMLHEEKTEIDAMVEDLTGEIANMVIGGAKKIFEDEGYSFGLTLPRVVSGPDHTIDHPVVGPKILLPFTSEPGEFFVEICFEE